MPTESQVEVGAVEVTVGVDTTQADAGMQQLMGRMAQMGNQMSGQASAGFHAWGTNASNSIMGVTNQMRSLSMAMGPESPMNSMLPMLNGLTIGFQHIKQAEIEAEASGRRFIGLGAGLQGLGMLILGIGAGLTQLGAPLQRAQAVWVTALQDTGHTVDEFSGKLKAAQEAGAKFGFTNADITDGLAKMTAQTKDPVRAFNDLQFAETLAAASGDKTKTAHMSLATAADQVGRMHAGMFRSLRPFGILLPQVRFSADALANAEKKLADDTQRLQDAQTKLNDFEQKMAQERADRVVKTTEKVNEEEAKVADAKAIYQDKAQQYNDADKMRADSTAAAVEDSTQRQQDALQNLQDIKDRMDSKSTQSQDMQMALADAEERVNAARVKVATTSGVAQQVAIQEEHKANEELIRVKNRQKDETVRNNKDLHKAQEEVTKSGQAHTKAEEDQKKAVDEHALHLTELKKAQDDLAKSEYALGKAKADAAKADQLSLTQKAEEVRLQEGVNKALETQQTEQGKVNDLKNEQARVDAIFQQAQQQFMERYGGLLQNQAKTFAGHVAAIKAHVLDFLQSAGKFAPAALGLGAALQIGTTTVGAARGIGRMARRMRGGPVEEAEQVAEEGLGGGAGKASGKMKDVAKEAEEAEQKVTSSAKKMGEGAQELEKLEKGGGKLASGIDKIKGIGSSLGGIVSSVVSTGGAIAAAGWAAILPWLPLVAAIAAVGAIGYIIYRNWDTIKAGLVAAWHWVWDQGKKIWEMIVGVFHWAKDHIKEILIVLAALFTPPIGPLAIAIILLAKHWKEVWSGIKQVAEEIWNFMLEGVKNLVDGILGGVDILVKGLSHLPGPFGAPFKEAHKLLQGFKKDIDGTLDDLKVSTSKKSEEVGQAIGTGVTGGLASTAPQAQAAAGSYVDTINTGMQTHGKIQSPSKLFAEQVGKPIAEGVALGLTQHGSMVGDASRKLLEGVAAQRGTWPSASTAPQGGGGGTGTAPSGGGEKEDQGWRGARVIHLEPHFNQEISPMHAAHEIAWSLDGL